MNGDADPDVPVLLVRTGPDEFAAVTPGQAPGWDPLGPAAAMSALKLFGMNDGSASQGASARYFTARPEDLKIWDHCKKHGPGGGYVYGTAWGKDGKIAKNVAFREAMPPRTAARAGLPVDPVMLANAIAMAQVQASIDRLTGLVEKVAQDLKKVVAFLHLEQEATVLAAVETIDSVHSTYRADGALGSLDWERVAGLEQVVKQQHRQILGELREAHRIILFRDIDAARESLSIEPKRIQNLITLEFFLLRTLARWIDLMLAAKQDRDELTESQVRDARALVESYQRDAREAVLALHGADSDVRGRPWWNMLFTDGLVLGEHRDNAIKEQATKNREAIRAITKVGERIVLPARPMLALLPAPSTPGRQRGAQITA